jgi:hypothetical protein
MTLLGVPKQFSKIHEFGSGNLTDATVLHYKVP